MEVQTNMFGATSHPALTTELSRQIEVAHVEFAIERLEGIAQQAGNPHGVGITRFGRCVALTAALPVVWMNTVHVVGEPELGPLREAVLACRSLGRHPRVEILPADLTPELSGTLSDLGLAQVGFHAATFSVAHMPVATRPTRIDVRAVTADTFEPFLDTFLAGFGSSVSAKQNMRHWIKRPNWRLYLAFLNGDPAGAGVLSVHGPIAYLAAAATVPTSRGRGCQASLIDRRVADSFATGCDLVVAQCDYGSVSHRNLHRAGLQLAYTKAIWAPR